MDDKFKKVAVVAIITILIMAVIAGVAGQIFGLPEIEKYRATFVFAFIVVMGFTAFKTYKR